MKICVFSDSHGGVDNMIRATERESPDMCFFLGDGERDLARYRVRFPHLSVFSVRGNCDLRSEDPIYLCGVFGGVKIFATHGHQHHVKYDPGYYELKEAAQALGARVVLFGHTHEAYLNDEYGLMLMNPGSIGRHRYGILEINDGELHAKLKM